MGLNVGSLFDASSKSEAFDQRIAGADQSQVAAHKSNIANPNSILLTGSAKLLTGDTISVAKGGTLTVNDPSAILDIAGMFNDSLKTVSSTGSSNLTQAITAMGDQVKDSLKKLSELGKTQATGGDSERNKVLMWVMLGVLGLVGAIFYFKR